MPLSAEDQIRLLGVSEGQLVIAVEAMSRALEGTGGYLPHADHGHIAALVGSSMATCKSALRCLRDHLTALGARTERT